MRAVELLDLPIEELRHHFVKKREELPRGGLHALLADDRQGARQIGEQLQRRVNKKRAEECRLTRLSAFEAELWENGITLVGGVDEVGMAPLTRPVITAAVILPRG